MITPYCRIHSLNCSNQIRSVKPSRGEIKYDETSSPGRDYGTIYDQGRIPKNYDIEARFLPGDEANLDDFLDQIANLPEDAEFYPFRDDRCVYIKKAYAAVHDPQVGSDPITGTVKYLAEVGVKILTRESCVYGTPQGIDLTWNANLPQVSALLTNGGNIEAGLDYLSVSGDWDVSLGYTTNLSFRLTPVSSSVELDKFVLLCSNLMRNDRFQVDRWGNVWHSYATTFPMLYAELQTDLLGATYCNYGSGGSIAYQAFTLGASGKILLPFYGPLPGSSACLDFVATAITGTPDIQVSYLTNLSDLAMVTFTPSLGANHIDIPGCAGKSFIAFGIVTGVGEAITISSITGKVDRYIAESQIPKFERTLTFKIRVEDQTSSNHKLKHIRARYRDLFRI